jgi:hypothetical protein
MKKSDKIDTINWVDCFSTEHAALKSTRKDGLIQNQDNVSKLSHISA